MNYILIDDDDLIHELWKMAAKDKAINLSCFSDVEEFLSNSSAFDPDAIVYIDSNLKDAKGEEEAIKVNKAGFQNIFIATGYDSESISAPEFIKGVVGKRPPF